MFMTCRRSETEADSIGMRLAAKACYDPAAAGMILCPRLQFIVMILSCSQLVGSDCVCTQGLGSLVCDFAALFSRPSDGSKHSLVHLFCNAAAVFQNLGAEEAEAGGAQIPGFLRTHPLTEDRIKNVQKQLPAASVIYAAAGCEGSKRYMLNSMFGPHSIVVEE